jgi:lactoylglutathione lyase
MSLEGRHVSAFGAHPGFLVHEAQFDADPSNERRRERVIDQLFPIINAVDVGRSLAFWRDLLGGTVAFEWPGPDGQPVYVGLDVGSSHLGIGGPSTPTGEGPRPIALWVYTDDCDATIERLRTAGVTITEEPADQPWGERVARVLDPDGNEVIVGQRADSSTQRSAG